MNRSLKIVGIVIALLLVAAIALPFLVDVNSFRPRLESRHRRCDKRSLP